MSFFFWVYELFPVFCRAIFLQCVYWSSSLARSQIPAWNDICPPSLVFLGFGLFKTFYVVWSKRRSSSRHLYAFERTAVLICHRNEEGSVVPPHISVVLVWTVWVKVIGNVALKGVERPKVFGSGPVELIQDFTDSSLCSAHLLSLLRDKSLWISSFDHRGDFNMWMAWWNRRRLSENRSWKRWRKWEKSKRAQVWLWLLWKYIIWSCLNTVLGMSLTAIKTFRLFSLQD